MSEPKSPQRYSVKIVKSSDAELPISKADTSTALDTSGKASADDWTSPPLYLSGLREMVKHSSILPQCIRAYKNNIAGFGIGIRYRDDIEETSEMVAEYTRAEELLELLTLEQDTKEVFEDIIDARETFGISYLEVIRNTLGEVVQIDFIRDVPSITKTVRLSPYVDASYFYKGNELTRKKKFCKYRQNVAGKTVYFKEFGDPRIMDATSGIFDDTTPPEKWANEIIEFTIGTEPYGEVRWLGQLLGIDGSRRAESLNNNYFKNGRHTPLMIVLKGGMLTEESEAKLQEYIAGIKGEAGQHAFIILEAENNSRTDLEGERQPEIEIKDLASILQKDELFQEYLDNNRRRVQSSFQLPDLYVGYTTDFNRATAQTAQEVTEKQVFQPERRSLAWIVNNKLLNGYGFQYVEAYFKEPDITNPDDLAKILGITERAGGLTPNKAKEITFSILGDNFEPYEGDWGDMPLAVSRPSQSELQPSSDILGQLDEQIQKAAANRDDEILAIMKEVRDLYESQFAPLRGA